MKIPQAFIDEILTRTDIVELIETRVALKKTGANYSALCPFHTEKSPSFTVSPTKQFYYCFGCSAHGNAIGFLIQYERLDFMEAIQTLAAKVGLEIPKDDLHQTTDNSQHQELYSLLADAAKYYQLQLRQSAAAIDYLKARGLTGQIAKQYGMGYAPTGWDNLLRELGKNTKMRDQLIIAGMLIKKEDGKSYDRFRSRIMFPIRDLRGRVIAFGGRTLGDELPKYLNSPETPVFHKGHELYGLYEARRACQTLEKIVIVEGYMDVIALAQHGIAYAVATLGTATQAQHIQKLFRYSSNIFFCFDGDIAGQKAAWRALEVTLPLMRDGMRVNFVFLPTGEDPDSFVRKQGKAIYEQQLAKATALSDFFFQHLQQEIDLKTADGKARLASLAKQLLSKIQQGIFQTLMLEKLGEIIGVDSEKLQTTVITPTPSPKNNSKKNLGLSYKKSPVALAITLLLQHPALVKQVDCLAELHHCTIKGIEILIQLITLLQQHPSLTTGAVLEHWRDHPLGVELAKLAVQPLMISAEGLHFELQGTLQRILASNQEQRIHELLSKAKQKTLTPEEKKQLQQLITEKNT
jgi:DNA primase